MIENDVPDAKMTSKPLPPVTAAIPAFPYVGNPENTVSIGGKLIEIKPTKLKYMRNRTAAFYKILELYPLADILAMDAGAFGDDRDGDKAVLDWLIAVLDDEALVLANYNDLDAETIEKMVIIYKRVNRVEEKEARLKNLTAVQTEAE